MPKKNPSSNGHSDLLKELWEAAVRLRGSIEPADYKRYVLPIIFLRFLSLRFEERRRELERLLDDPKSDYYATDVATRAAVLEDPDEYRATGAFIVPVNARWDAIVEAARRDDLKTHLDDVLQSLEDAYPTKLRGLLPRIYAGSNLDVEDLRGLINTFSRDVFRQDHDGEDLIGKVYEYFIGEFANSEGKRGGEYFTPASIVRTLVAMLEPTEGVVLDPCCGSGGMFVQSDIFTEHSHRLSFVGQESKDFTYRLCRMNLFIHGLDGKVELGNTYLDDKHADVKADYIIANPPFNDGSKSREGWGADKVAPKDARLLIGKKRMPLAARNANTMWILHFLHHLRANGTAGFVMATGELSTAEIARLEVRKALIDEDLVDCIVQLPAQLFANTQIGCSLWFLSKDRDGSGETRARKGQVLFIDARQMGKMIPGSRKQKELSSAEIDQIAAVYREFKRTGAPAEVSGFCRVADADEIATRLHLLTPGPYVGSASEDADTQDYAGLTKTIRHLEAQTDENGRLLEIEGAAVEALLGIDLTQQSSAALLAIAHALFRAWFIDCDPVTARAEGRPAVGLTPEISALFPSEFEDVDGVEVPVGWTIESLDSIAKFKNGLAMQAYPPDDNGFLPVVKIRELREGTTDGADHASLDVPKDVVIDDGDVVFSWSGTLMVRIWCGGRAALNQHLFRVTSDRYPKWFYLFWTLEHLESFQATADDKKTTMGHIKRHHLTDSKVIVPSAPLLAAVSPLFVLLLERIVLNAVRTRSIESLCDNFLAAFSSDEADTEIAVASP